MLGDTKDFTQRFATVLPRGWFADDSPIADLLLSCLGAAWASIYNLIGAVTGLTRISSTTGQFLDLVSADYFGSRFQRKNGEADAAFSLRIRQELLRKRVTRAALQQVLQDITGQLAEIVEPARPADTGAYARGGVGYGQAGAWGSLASTHCFFVTAYRPKGGGIATIAGYGTGGPVIYGNLTMMGTAISDLDIYAAAAAALPLGATAWLRIKSRAD